MTASPGGFPSPFAVNSVFVQSHYPWSSDPNVIFALVADSRYRSSGDNNIGLQTLSQDQSLQKSASFGMASGPYTFAQNWGSKNLGSITFNGVNQAAESVNPVINAAASGTNTSYTLFFAAAMLSGAGNFRSFGGWTNTAKPSNDFAFQRTDNLNPAHYVAVRAGDAGGILTATTTQTVDANRHVLCYVFDGSGPNMTIYLDNVVTSVNAAPLSVGNIITPQQIFTIAASHATGLANFGNARYRTILAIRGVLSAARRDAYTRFMLSELA